MLEWCRRGNGAEGIVKCSEEVGDRTGQRGILCVY